MMIFDHDGDDGAGVCSSHSKSLSGDHHHTIFGNSPLNTLRPSWRRYRQRRSRGSGTSDVLTLIDREWIW